MTPVDVDDVDDVLWWWRCRNMFRPVAVPVQLTGFDKGSASPPQSLRVPRATSAYDFGGAILTPCKRHVVLAVQGFRLISYGLYSMDIDIKSHTAVTGSSDPSDTVRSKDFDEEFRTVVNSAVAKVNILLVLPTTDPDLDTEIEALEMTVSFSRE
ncbi:hypothetical protein INS49_012802 [Diaporthe citri]|uniref:uncharacterized protein n=1 Tax=Diaporthe citri TaxID=83186 RepID=UPI001C8147FE|nr:uncharacterized protein INS49_012802 [Diaporthe citri]KAG6359281.1 hypothetical protein INS49_012802 [Diaporthe citri]